MASLFALVDERRAVQAEVEQGQRLGADLARQRFVLAEMIQLALMLSWLDRQLPR
jgi:hypothetical protein